MSIIPTIQEKVRRQSPFVRNFSPILLYEKIISDKIAKMAKERIITFHSKSDYLSHGYTSGILHESNLWQIASNIENCRPFSLPEEIVYPDFHLGILVDCSGSMAARSSQLVETVSKHGLNNADKRAYSRLSNENSSLYGNGSMTVMSAARILCMGFTKALENNPGIKLAVAGHTEMMGSVDVALIKSQNKKADYEKFGFLTSCAGNLDGLALDVFADQINESKESRDPGLIVLICDGAPCHEDGLMLESINRCQKLYNVSVLPVGVGGLAPFVANNLYGEGKYVLAPDVISSIPAIIKRMNYMIEELRPM